MKKFIQVTYTNSRKPTTYISLDAIDTIEENFDSATIKTFGGQSFWVKATVDEVLSEIYNLEERCVFAFVVELEGKTIN